MIRLQKYLARCGIGSRRHCETYIEQGRITIDGKKVTQQGICINPKTQQVRFDTKPVFPKPIEWIMLNKPPQYLSTTKNQSAKKSFLTLLPETKRHLFAVGRLDYLSEGLLLITNEGEVANRLIHPRYEIEKEYQVRTIDKISDEQMQRMKKGLMIQKDNLSVKTIRLLQRDNGESFYDYAIVISEGKNRHIRKMLDHLNIRIRSLQRVRIGPIYLGNLTSGNWRYLTDDEHKKIHSLIMKK